MGQLVYTFYSPKSVTDTIEMIKSTILSLNGKIVKQDENKITGHWRSKQFISVLPVKFYFYVGVDMVRVLVNSNYARSTSIISPQRKLCGEEKIWNTFIEALISRYPHIDFGLVPGVAKIDTIKLVGDGTEQVFTSKTQNHPSLGGALIGGALFGTAGAVVGSMGGYSVTTGKNTLQFSDKVLATVRYTNGLIFEGEMMKKSHAYNEILANMSLYTKNE